MYYISVRKLSCIIGAKDMNPVTFQSVQFYVYLFITLRMIKQAKKSHTSIEAAIRKVNFLCFNLEKKSYQTFPKDITHEEVF